MGKIEKFEDLEVWQEAVSIGVDIYNLTCMEKLKRDFSARDQLRRAAISISNNIAEGFEYNNTKMFLKFLKYAKGSAGELRSNLYVLTEAEVVAKDDYSRIHGKLMQISKRLKAFMNYLNNVEQTRK